MLGDNEKVTFVQELKAADLKTEGITDLKDGVLTLKSTSSPGGPAELIDLISTSHNGATFFYRSSEIVSTKVAGAFFGDNAGNFRCTLGEPTAEVNVWKVCSAVANKSATNGLPSYTVSLSLGTVVSVPAGDVCKVRNSMFVDIRGLGVSDTVEAKAVWEKLNKYEYFEGEKSFTKGQIKAAIADYEKEQAALKASVAAGSAAASSAAA